MANEEASGPESSEIEGETRHTSERTHRHRQGITPEQRRLLDTPRSPSTKPTADVPAEPQSPSTPAPPKKLTPSPPAEPNRVQKSRRVDPAISGVLRPPGNRLRARPGESYRDTTGNHDSGRDPPPRVELLWRNQTQLCKISARLTKRAQAGPQRGPLSRNCP